MRKGLLEQTAVTSLLKQVILWYVLGANASGNVAAYNRRKYYNHRLTTTEKQPRIRSRLCSFVFQWRSMGLIFRPLERARGNAHHISLERIANHHFNGGDDNGGPTT
jgi:hypothetical protein